MQIYKFFLSLAAYLEAKYFSFFGEPINSRQSASVRYEQIRADVSKAQSPFDFAECCKAIDRYKSDFGTAGYSDYMALNLMLLRKHNSVKRRENDMYKSLQSA